MSGSTAAVDMATAGGGSIGWQSVCWLSVTGELFRVILKNYLNTNIFGSN